MFWFTAIVGMATVDIAKNDSLYQFTDICTEWPQNGRRWTPLGSDLLHTYVWLIVLSLHWMASKWQSLNTTRVNLLHTYVWLIILISLKCHCFALPPAICNLQAILRHVHRMTPQNWPWKLHGQRYPIYALLLSRSLNVTPFRSMSNCFPLRARDESDTPTGPKMTLTITRSTVPHVCITSPS